MNMEYKKPVETELCKLEKDTVCFDMKFIKGTSVMKKVEGDKITYYFGLKQENGDTWGWGVPVDKWDNFNEKITIESVCAEIEKVNNGLPTKGYIYPAEAKEPSELIEKNTKP
jgi:hypothetical protein